MLLKKSSSKSSFETYSFISETYFKENDLTFRFLYSLCKSSDRFPSGNGIGDVPLLTQNNLTVLFWTILSSCLRWASLARDFLRAIFVLTSVFLTPPRRPLSLACQVLGDPAPGHVLIPGYTLRRHFHPSKATTFVLHPSVNNKSSASHRLPFYLFLIHPDLPTR